MPEGIVSCQLEELTLHHEHGLQLLGTWLARQRRMAKKAAKKTATKRKAAKRELVNTRSDKRFVRRGAGGKFKESDDVSRSLSADPRKKAKAKAKRGQGDRGDR